METLLSPGYNDARRRLVSDAATLELRPGEVEGHGAVRMLAGDGAGGAAGAGEPGAVIGARADSDTVHIDCADRFGNLVSATPSGAWLHSSPAVPGLGFPLTTRAQMFWLDEGHPAGLAPGKRPRTTLSVNYAEHEDGRRLAFGTPGGDYQDQWTLAFFLRWLHHGLNLQEAIDAPMFHTDHMPSSFYPRAADLGSLALEARFPPATVEALERRGHRLEPAEPWSLGRLSAAGFDGEVLTAAANPRFMQGYAVGR